MSSTHGVREHEMLRSGLGTDSTTALGPPFSFPEVKVLVLVGGLFCCFSLTGSAPAVSAQRRSAASMLHLPGVSLFSPKSSLSLSPSPCPPNGGKKYYGSSEPAPARAWGAALLSRRPPRGCGGSAWSAPLAAEGTVPAGSAADLTRGGLGSAPPASTACRGIADPITRHFQRPKMQ